MFAKFSVSIVSISCMILATYSLAEIFIVLVIIGILASFYHISYRKTAKQEAEKISEFLHGLMRKADRMHSSFKIVFSSAGVNITYPKNDGSYSDPELIPVSSGFNLNSGNSNEIEYSSYAFSGINSGNRTLTVTRNSDNTTYKIIIYQNGRIHTQAP